MSVSRYRTLVATLNKPVRVAWQVSGRKILKGEPALQLYELHEDSDIRKISPPPTPSSSAHTSDEEGASSSPSLCRCLVRHEEGVRGWR